MHGGCRASRRSHASCRIWRRACTRPVATVAGGRAPRLAGATVAVTRSSSVHAGGGLGGGREPATIEGDGLSTRAADLDVAVGGRRCRVVAANLSHVRCVAPVAANPTHSTNVNIPSACAAPLPAGDAAASVCSYTYSRATTRWTAATVDAATAAPDWTVTLVGSFGNGGDFPTKRLRFTSGRRCGVIPQSVTADTIAHCAAAARYADGVPLSVVGRRARRPRAADSRRKASRRRRHAARRLGGGRHDAHDRGQRIFLEHTEVSCGEAQVTAVGLTSVECTAPPCCAARRPLCTRSRSRRHRRHPPRRRRLAAAVAARRAAVGVAVAVRAAGAAAAPFLPSPPPPPQQCRHRRRHDEPERRRRGRCEVHGWQHDQPGHSSGSGPYRSRSSPRRRPSPACAFTTKIGGRMPRPLPDLGRRARRPPRRPLQHRGARDKTCEQCEAFDVEMNKEIAAIRDLWRLPRPRRAVPLRQPQDDHVCDAPVGRFVTILLRVPAASSTREVIVYGSALDSPSPPAAPAPPAPPPTATATVELRVGV